MSCLPDDPHIFTGDIIQARILVTIQVVDRSRFWGETLPNIHSVGVKTEETHGYWRAWGMNPRQWLPRRPCWL
jgi:hypothetical protein